MNFRCTRNSPYKAPSCPGRNDLTARQGYNIKADSSDDAVRQMTLRFPEDVVEYNTPQLAFTVSET